MLMPDVNHIRQVCRPPVTPNTKRIRGQQPVHKAVQQSYRVNQLQHEPGSSSHPGPVCRYRHPVEAGRCPRRRHGRTRGGQAAIGLRVALVPLAVEKMLGTLKPLRAKPEATTTKSVAGE